MKIRKDNLGRNLRIGETQDKKTLKYRYRYTDSNNVVRERFSWQLVEGDALPENIIIRKKVKPLRQIEEEIKNNHYNSDIVHLRQTKLYEATESYLDRLKAKVSKNTLKTYKVLLRRLKQFPIAYQRISDITTLEVKNFLINLQNENNYSYQYMENFRALLRPMFDEFVESEIIVKNPIYFNFKKAFKATAKKISAYTPEELETIYKFFQSDPVTVKKDLLYYYVAVILENTGLRIGELSGLTIDDLHLDDKYINIDKQMQVEWVPNVEKKFYITKPKTTYGIRKVPLNEKAIEAFKQILEIRPLLRKEPVVDGYTNFIFINDITKMPFDTRAWNKIFDLAKKRLNDKYKTNIVLTCHRFRHTYSSNLCKKGVSPKVHQMLMGHANIQMSLDVYTDLTLQDIMEEVKIKGIV